MTAVLSRPLTGGACTGADPTLFYIDAADGESSRARNRRLTSTATLYCAGCPIASRCLAEASGTDLSTTMRAGMVRLAGRTAAVSVYRLDVALTDEERRRGTTQRRTRRKRRAA